MKYFLIFIVCSTIFLQSKGDDNSVSEEISEYYIKLHERAKLSASAKSELDSLECFRGLIKETNKEWYDELWANNNLNFFKKIFKISCPDIKSSKICLKYLLEHFSNEDSEKIESLSEHILTQVCGNNNGVTFLDIFNDTKECISHTLQEDIKECTTFFDEIDNMINPSEENCKTGFETRDCLYNSIQNMCELPKSAEFLKNFINSILLDHLHCNEEH